MSEIVRHKRVKRSPTTAAAKPAATGRARSRRKAAQPSEPSRKPSRKRLGKSPRQLRRLIDLEEKKETVREVHQVAILETLKNILDSNEGRIDLENGGDRDGARTEKVGASCRTVPVTEGDSASPAEPQLTPWSFPEREPTAEEREKRNAEIAAIVAYRKDKIAIAKALDADPNAITYIRPDMVGNRLWMLAKGKLGAPRHFDSPDAMREAVADYFTWVEKNPLYEFKTTQFQGAVVRMHLPKMRAMSKRALCLHLGITRATWDAYRVREGFEELVKGIEDAIYAQKFEGAAADLLSPMVICRDLGLKDRSDITSGDDPITDIIRTVIRDAGPKKPEENEQ